MSNLARFEFDGHVVEAFTDNSKRDWFRGTQVCKVLGFGNSSVSINRHAQEYSREWKIGEGRPSLYVSEPGLYALIFASKTDSADKFKKWIFEEVSPALRKEGAYISPNISLEQLDRLDQNSKRLRALRLDAM